MTGLLELPRGFGVQDSFPKEPRPTPNLPNPIVSLSRRREWSIANGERPGSTVVWFHFATAHSYSAPAAPGAPSASQTPSLDSMPCFLLTLDHSACIQCLAGSVSLFITQSPAQRPHDSIQSRSLHPGKTCFLCHFIAYTPVGNNFYYYFYL